MTARSNDRDTGGLARRFLLGELTAAEAEQFEEDLLKSDELIDEVETAEDDLFDAFVRDQLTPNERRLFVGRFGDQQQRIAFARALDAKVREQVVVPLRPERRASIRYAFAAAASIIVVTGAILLWRSQPAVPIPAAEPSPVVTTSTGISSPIAAAPPAASIAAIEIALVSTRGSDQAPHLVLSPTDGSVALSIRLNPADRFAAYTVVIRKSDGSNVWHGQAALASTGKIAVRIPASLFASGDYEIAVTGLRAGRSAEDLGYRTITVDARAPSP
jgi:hypothetical protein